MAYVKMHSYMKAYISYKVNKTTIYYAYINVLDLSCVGRSVGKTIIMPITVKPRRRKEIHMRDNSLEYPVPRPQTFWLRTLAVDMVVAFSNKSRDFGANPGVFFWSVRYSLTTSGLNCPCTSRGQCFSCK